MNVTLLKRLPNETLYSLVGRISIVNGCKREFLQLFSIGTPNKDLLGDELVDLEVFHDVTRGYFLNKPILTLSNYRSIFDTSIKSLGRATLICHSNYDAHLWRWCPTCTSDDTSEHGFSYWRTNHQLPGIHFCVIHQTALLEVNIPYRDRQGQFFLPANLLAKNITTRVSKIFETEDSFSRFSALTQTQVESVSQVSPLELVNTIIFGLSQRKLISKSGTPKQEAITHEILNNVGVSEEYIKTNQAGFIKYFSYLGSPSPLGVTPPIFLNPIISNLLILGLFNNWDGFLSANRWQFALNFTNPDQAQTLGLQTIGGTYSVHRDVCLQYLVDNPISTRTDFWLRHPKACRWLLKYDSQWLNSKLPLLKVLATGKQFQLL